MVFALSSVRQLDARNVEVVFNLPANDDYALNPLNYSITDDVVVKSVTKISPFVYQLKTSKQLAQTPYVLTVMNILDLAGELI